MSCEHSPQSGPYLDRELPAAAHAAFESHLPTCAECTQECARLQRLSRFLSAAATSTASHPRVAFQARLNRRRMEHFAEFLMGAAAVVIVVCGISLMKSTEQTSHAAPKNWERLAINQPVDTSGSEADDPLVQVLLREQP